MHTYVYIPYSVFSKRKAADVKFRGNCVLFNEIFTPKLNYKLCKIL